MPERGRARAPLLAVRELNAWYGESHILHGVAFDVAAGEVVTLLGTQRRRQDDDDEVDHGHRRRAARGRSSFDGAETIRSALEPDCRISASRSVPEERGIFSSLNVEENLLLPPKVQEGGLTVEQIFTLFPNLKERLSSQGTKLSGGEQQMLAIGRILRTGARLLLLDEPTEGLAPVIVQQIGRTIAQLKAQGFTILLVEQNFHFAATVADRHYVMENGRVVDMIPNGRARCQHGEAARVPRCLTERSSLRFCDIARPIGALESQRGESMNIVKRTAIGLAIAAALGVGATAAQAQISDNMIKIGVLSDMSSLYTDLAGAGSVVAAKMAVEDSGIEKRGYKVEIVSADHQNKADVGSNIARQWYDVDKVDVIVDVPNSGVALAVNQITKDKGKAFLAVGPGTSDLTGKACSPNTVHWAYDTWMLANGTGTAITKQGGDTWFFITADYAFGAALERDTDGRGDQRPAER